MSAGLGQGRRHGGAQVAGARVVTEWRFEPVDSGRATRVTHSMDVEFPDGVHVS